MILTSRAKDLWLNERQRDRGDVHRDRGRRDGARGGHLGSGHIIASENFKIEAPILSVNLVQRR